LKPRAKPSEPSTPVDILAHNRWAWDRNVDKANPWTIPVDSEQIEAARKGRWEIVLTPSKPVPKSWFPDLEDCDVLCLASGGGQQGPILAAAGARVTVFDNSPKQLEQDRFVAQRDELNIATALGDMADLSVFPDASFDLIFHPVSNVFVPQIRPVWREAYRVLRSGGSLLAGVTNPLRYLFDFDLYEQGIFQVKYKIPYSDLTSISDVERQQLAEKGFPLEFGHTLEDQIGGQLDAGFLLAGFYEDNFEDETDDPLSPYIAMFIATRAIKPHGNQAPGGS
jgi:SAM-dependent methyltransferase